jgi:hypothetical protein
LKFCGRYSVLIAGHDTTAGVAWYAPSTEVIGLLREYEGVAYNDSCVNVEVETGETALGRAFIWARGTDVLSDEEGVLEYR